MNQRFKLFLSAGIPFGMFVGVFNSFKFDVYFGAIIGVIAGICFGGLMSLVLSFLHGGRPVKVHHVRNIELKLPYDKAFDLCLESIGLIKRCKVLNEKRAQNKIEAKAGISWKMWGDVISFEIHKKGNDEVHVEVSSRPAVSTTLVDYGKNLENVEKIVGFLHSHKKNIA